MAGELLKKVNELNKLIKERNNKLFKRNAVEYLNNDALDEMVEIQPREEDVCTDCEVGTDPTEYENYRLEIKQFILEAIADEEDATAFYLKKARKCNDKGEFELAELFKELAGDEMVHSAQLRTALEIYGLSDLSKEIEGRREAFQILAKSVFEDLDADIAALDKEVEHIHKNFDFVREYSKDKIKYNKEKVVGIINDLIAGNIDIESAIEKIVNDCKGALKAGKKQSKKDKE